MTIVLDAAAEQQLFTASQLFRTGRDVEAIAAYQALLAREPRLPDSWFNLGILLRRTRQPKAALTAYENALEHGVSGADEVHVNRGVILSDDLGDHAAARVELEAALELVPGYLPAWLNLGNIEEDLGDWPAASAAYQRALDLDPGNAMALARLATLSPIQVAEDPLLQRLFDASVRPDAPLLERADAGFALGAALDRIGEYEAAFEAYTEANRTTRGIAATGQQAYDRVADSRLVDRLIAAFPGQVLQLPDNGEAPIFICGMLRSGSTLVEELLAQHSRLSGGGELDILPGLVDDRLQPYPEAVATADLAEIRDIYLAQTAPRRADGTRLIDKRPDNIFHVGLIKTMFPRARIIHTTRERVDNCLSVYFLHAAPQLAYATSLDDIAHRYAEQQRLAAHWHAAYPADLLELNYDQLVAEPRATIDTALAFLGLAYEEGMLERRVTTRAVRTASHWQVRQPLYQTSSGRWRNYQRFLTAAKALAL